MSVAQTAGEATQTLVKAGICMFVCQLQEDPDKCRKDNKCDKDDSDEEYDYSDGGDYVRSNDS